MGCTNVGKSSLFNILLQSDFCKTQASDLIQRATTSPWPGTTLNLLKFPVMQPSGWLHFMRLKRLSTGKKMLAEQRRLQREKLKNTKNPEYATLIGNYFRTVKIDRDLWVKDTWDGLSRWKDKSTDNKALLRQQMKMRVGKL